MPPLSQGVWLRCVSTQIACLYTTYLYYRLDPRTQPLKANCTITVDNNPAVFVQMPPLSLKESVATLCEVPR